jgi:hypothetical protein
VAARKAYVDYIDHVHALAAIALKAADDVPGAGEMKAGLCWGLRGYLRLCDMV